MIVYNEERCCDNEIALQEYEGIYNGMPEEERAAADKYTHYDYYCDVRDGKAEVPIYDRELFKINMGIIICRFSISEDIVSDYKKGEGIWADKFWGFSPLSPAVIKAVCGYYAGWQYSEIYLEGGGVPDGSEIAYAPNLHSNTGGEFLVVHEKCLPLYVKLYGNQ